MSSNISIAGTITVSSAASGFSTRIPLQFPLGLYASVGVIEKTIPAGGSVSLSMSDLGTLAPCVMVLTSNSPVSVQDTGASSLKASGTLMIIGNATSSPVIAATTIQITNPSLTTPASIQVTIGFNGA